MSEVERHIEAAPGAVEDIISWVNSTFGTSYKSQTLLDEIKLTPKQTSNYAGDVSSGVFSLAGGIASGVFNAFAILMFTSYIPSSMPRLRVWIASLFTPARQPVVLTVMEVFVSKVGGYVSARVILAICSATAHSIVMIAMGMPYWLALGLCVGVVSAFIPTVGTYIAITLPALRSPYRPSTQGQVLTSALPNSPNAEDCCHRVAAILRATCSALQRARAITTKAAHRNR